MARAKTGSTQDITPMPFPGESPTVALALAAGRKYGLSDEEKETPRRSGAKRSGAKRSAKKPAKKKPVKKQATRKATAKARPARGRSTSKSR